MKAKSTPDELVIQAGAIKYTLAARVTKNDALQDLKKAQWYLNRLIKECER
jgi:hypothetical protein